jgi:thiol-disulfide isomerase/thioredoxin
MRGRSYVSAAGVTVVALLAVLACDRKAAPSADSPDAAFVADLRLPPLAERTSAPDFAGASAWINVDRPLTSADLEGRVTVVDFWTSCCINCLHTLPILAELEKKHAKDPVLVVGVHSPKFDAETENERLRSAIAENSITHPVAVDGAMKVWTRWQASSWPTIYVLDSKRRTVWVSSGEPNPIELEERVRAALDEGARAGTLTKERLTGLAPEAAETGPLAFPGKVIALKDGGFAVSDTGHHRIVLLDAAFAVKDVVGVGLAGLTDGPYAEASFKKPQGIAEDGDRLYVADTENHLLRVIDRKARTVKTVGGSGEIGRAVLKIKAPARTIALRSPWDLAFTGGLLYVALAGSHQIAIFDPKDGSISPWVGDGAERRVDGTGMEASLAQPSGLTTDGTTLWVADSETSSIRAITIGTRAVRTVVGKDLFVFGDVDGASAAVRLEHPLGVAWGLVAGKTPALFVADTYNSKVKRIDLATGSTRSLFGARSHQDLFEPSGLAIAKGDIVAVDTKHHRLVRLTPDADADLRMEPIALKGLVAPSRGIAVAVEDAGPAAPLERVEPAEVALSTAGATVKVGWSAPAGTGVNEDAPFRLRWNKTEGLAATPPPMKSTGRTVKDGFDLALKPAPGATHASLDGELDMVICDVATHAVCVPVRRQLVLRFSIAKDSPAPKLSVNLPEAKAR